MKRIKSRGRKSCLISLNVIYVKRKKRCIYIEMKKKIVQKKKKRKKEEEPKQTCDL